MGWIGTDVPDSKSPGHTSYGLAYSPWIPAGLGGTGSLRTIFDVLPYFLTTSKMTEIVLQLNMQHSRYWFLSLSFILRLDERSRDRIYRHRQR